MITPPATPLQHTVLRIGCSTLHTPLLQNTALLSSQPQRSKLQCTGPHPAALPDAAIAATAVPMVQPLLLDQLSPATPQQWHQLLQQASLDALLLPAEAITAPATTTAAPTAITTAQHHGADPLVLQLGSRPLLLLVHISQLQALPAAAPGRFRPTPPPPRLLLTPVCAHHQRRLAQLALLPLELERCPTPQQLITRLSRERLLLPAPWDLLEHPPWCNTPLLPLPPPLPLHEQLVLLVSPSASHPAITALTRALQQRINTQRQLLQR